MKKSINEVPLFWYIDLSKEENRDYLNEGDREEEFRQWINRASKDWSGNNMFDDYFDLSDGRIGLCSNTDWAHYGQIFYSTSAVTPAKMKEVGLESEVTAQFFFEEIKDRTYNVLTTNGGRTAIYIVDRAYTINVLSSKTRNELAVSVIDNPIIEHVYNGLNEGQKSLLDENPFKFRMCSLGDAERSRNPMDSVGLQLAVRDTRNIKEYHRPTKKQLLMAHADVRGRKIPWHVVKYMIKKRWIKKLSYLSTAGGYYDYYNNLTEALDAEGNTVQVSTYFTGLTISDSHGKKFISEEAAIANGFEYCEVQNDWVLESEVKEVPNARYHDRSLERKWLCPKDTEFTIGFEIEKEDSDAHPIGYKKLYKETSWIKERDGSLNESNGYELVTPVYNLMSSELETDINNHEKLKKLINAKYSSNCGGHINIGARGMTGMNLFYGLKGFFPLLYSIWKERVNNSYSNAMNPHNYFGNRAAFNIKDYVLEIRLASAVKSVKNMLWRRDLVRIMVKNINKSEEQVLTMMLNPKSILHKHLRKVYTTEKLYKRCVEFAEYAEQYNGIKLSRKAKLKIQAIKDKQEKNKPTSGSYNSGYNSAC
jgi:hypothetical protein